jgi:hypothetical protein
VILIEALFPTADDALTATTRLRTIDGVRDIRTEPRSGDGTADDRFSFPAGVALAFPGSVTSSSVNTDGVYKPLGLAPSTEFLAGGARDDRPPEVILTCRVDEPRLQEAIEAVRRAGGTIMTRAAAGRGGA